MEPLSRPSFQADCTFGIYVQLFYDAYELASDVILSHCGPQSIMWDHVKCLFEVDKGMEEVFLVLGILF